MILEFIDFTPPSDTTEYVIGTERETISYIITEDGEIKRHESGDAAIAAETDYVIRYTRNYVLGLIKKQLVEDIVINDDNVFVKLQTGTVLTGRLDPIIIDDVPKKLPEYFS